MNDFIKQHRFLNLKNFATFALAMNGNLAITKQPKWLFYSFSALTLASIFAVVLTSQYLLLGIPAFVLLLYLTIIDFRTIFFLLLFCIPLSTEIIFPNGFGTDLPTEPLIVGLMGVFFLYILRNGNAIDRRFFQHPITLLLLLHIGWIFIATTQSSMTFISIKFLLAKLWYIITFFFLAGMLLKEEKDVRKFFWCIFISLIFTVVVTLIRHAPLGFTFESVYHVLHPFYRNHVTYAAIMAVFVPFVWFARYWYPTFSTKWLILAAALVLLLIAIQLSYTRAAYAAIFFAVGGYFMIRWRLTKIAVTLATVFAISLVSYLVNDERYLALSPDYERTITHKDFNNLLEATYQLEDISTMERVYRWVAAFQMSNEKPLFGFGPGNFYTFYKGYTVTSFRTYVSDNPEQSGVHSYYLMTLVEQGYIGLIIFMIFIFFTLIYGEQIYHQTQNSSDKRIVMMALLAILVILSLQLINDLLETDKVGPFFFISVALLVNVDVKNRKRLNPIINQAM